MRHRSLLYRSYCQGVLTQELLHRSCYTGVVIQESISQELTLGVYLCLNSCKTPTSQVLLNVLSRRQGQPGGDHRNVTPCGDRAHRTHKLWRNANLPWGRATLCGDYACRTHKREVKCTFSVSGAALCRDFAWRTHKRLIKRGFLWRGILRRHNDPLWQGFSMWKLLCVKTALCIVKTFVCKTFCV